MNAPYERRNVGNQLDNISDISDDIKINLQSAITVQFFNSYQKDIDSISVKKPLRISVVGEFSSGKSTFINALIGKDLLSHSRNETTAVLTFIINSADEKLIAYFNNGDKPLEMELNSDNIKETTTVKSKNFNVAKDIEKVEIFLPFKEVSDDIIFVDTPGLNGVSDNHREITIKEIRNADASIILFIANKGLTDSSRELIRLLGKYQNKYIFVLNAIDQFNESEGEDINKEIERFNTDLTNLLNEEKISTDKITVFGVSSLYALMSKGDNFEVCDGELSNDKIININKRFEDLKNYIFNIINNEKNEIQYQKNIKYLSNIISVIRENLNQYLAIITHKIDNNELNLVEDKLKKMESSKKAFEDLIQNFIDAKGTDLIKYLKDDIKDKHDTFLEEIKDIINEETFESIQNFSENKYNNLIRSNSAQINSYIQDTIANHIKDIYNSAILKIQQRYKIEIKSDENEKLSIILPNYDQNNLHIYEDELIKNDKELKNINDNFKLLEKNNENFFNQIKQLTLTKQNKENISTQLLIERSRKINALGPKPEPKRIKKEIEKGGVFNYIGRLFGIGGTEIREEIDYSEVENYNKKLNDIYDYYNKELSQNQSELKMIDKEIENYKAKEKSNENEIYIAKRKKIDIEEEIKLLKEKREVFINNNKKKFLKETQKNIFQNIKDSLEKKEEKVIDLIKNTVQDEINKISKKINTYYNDVFKANIEKIKNIKIDNGEISIDEIKKIEHDIEMLENKLNMLKILNQSKINS